MNKADLSLKARVLISISILPILFSSSFAYADWVNVAPPPVSSNWELFGLHFLSPGEGWAVGQDSLNNRGVLLHFVNGAWAPVLPPPVSSDWGLSAVHFPSLTEGWAVGQDFLNNTGVLLHFVNGAWAPVPPPLVSLDWGLSGVHFISPGQGWAVGQDFLNRKGVILHFLNGAWTSFPSQNVNSSDWGLRSVRFLSPNEGWAVGQNTASGTGVLIHFSNGLWTPVALPEESSSWGLTGLNLISSSEGWTVGEDFSNLRGVLIHFSSGSSTSVSPPSLSSDWALTDVHFTSSNDGWAVGQDFANKTGALLHFLNGTWTTDAPPGIGPDWGLRGVFLTSSDSGWAVGHASEGENVRGVLLRYSVPAILVSPTSVNFKDVAIGAVKDQTVTISNNGNANLIIGSISSPSLPFDKKTDDCSGQHISPQRSCKLVYRFSPAAEGNFSSSIEIPSNDPRKSTATVTLNGSGIIGPPLFINLVSPSDGEGFTACSNYNPPLFQWSPSETFKSSEVQFSLQTDFQQVPLKVKAKAGAAELPISSTSWKKALLLAGTSSGTVYWKVVGTRTDGSLVESGVFSLIVEGPEPVLNAVIAPTSRATLPTLSWENNCNIKFKVWFGNDPDFSKPGIKKKGLSFSIKNPNDNGGQFAEGLSSGKWNAVRKVAGDASGSTLYWYVESSNVLKGTAKTAVNSFVLAD